MGWIFWAKDPDLESWMTSKAGSETMHREPKESEFVANPISFPTMPVWLTKQLLIHDRLKHWTPYPHQIETAQKVVHERYGRAILADEVGLGKTIETGLILAELILRGSVKNALILCPSSLVYQWARELHEKFQIPVRVYRKPFMWTHCPFLITTIETAKRSANQAILASQMYDMVIVDEAHQLKNPKSQNHRFVRQLRMKHCLLLTATPIQNELKELYHLSDLLRPGHWTDPSIFRTRYMQGKRGIKNEKDLLQQIRGLWIRNQRRACGIDLPERKIHLISVELSSQERKLYEAVSAYVRTTHQQDTSKNERLTAMILQREVCSSRDALFLTLTNQFGKLSPESSQRKIIWELVEQIRLIDQSSKSKQLLELVKRKGGKFVVFTAFRATQEHLIHQFRCAGISAVHFFGRMKRSKRDWMLEQFRDHVDVLVATDAGSEGLNLQHCHQIVNYDLPWNPMRLEQRIGRIHRIGQINAVDVYHLVVANSIETYILQILSEKTDLIRRVTGMDTPLTEMKDEQQWENNWFQQWIKHSSV